MTWLSTATYTNVVDTTHTVFLAPILAPTHVPEVDPCFTVFIPQNGFFWGSGVEYGTVTVNQVTLFPNCLVRVYSYVTGQLIAETRSDATGHYEFNFLAKDTPFFVVGYDHTGTYNIVIKGPVYAS